MSELIFETRGPVAHLTLNRPQARNAFSPSLLAATIAALHQVEADPAIRCVILSGAGEHFSAGGDVQTFGQALGLPPAQRQAAFQDIAEALFPLFDVIDRMPQPLIAKVRGAVAGFSVGLVAACDFVLAAPDASFFVAHGQLGLSPDGGVSWWLPRAVGPRRAREMALLGARLTAAEAVEAGLANRVVDGDGLDAGAEVLAAQLSARSATAVAETRRLLNSASDATAAAHMAREAQAFGRSAATGDFLEGVRAFVEKRPPRFDA